MTSEIAPAGEGREPAAVDRELRASYEDRDKVAEQLRVAAGDGRLTADELDQRLEAALTARTYGELAALTADLPGVARVEPGCPGRPAAAGRAASKSPAPAVKREGQWEVPQHLDVRVGSGTVVLDLTRSPCRTRASRSTPRSAAGACWIVTRPGVEVDATDVTIRSGQVKIRSPWGTPLPASLAIHVTGPVTSGSITARPPRRTFWEWLRRMRWHLADQ